MIKVKLQRLPGSDIKNNVAKDIAREIEKDYKNVICNAHPKKTSYIILIVRRMKLRKGSFCCSEFKKKVKVK